VSHYNANGFRALLAAVIDRAIGDLKGAGPPCRKIETDRAMAFILSDTCEAYCLELGMDCQTVREKAAALYRQCLEREEPETPPRTAQVIPAFRLCRACSLSA
jgi:hypothetical protein